MIDFVNVIPIETASDHSDIEGRVRALKDALKRRKMEADRLREAAEETQQGETQGTRGQSQETA